MDKENLASAKPSGADQGWSIVPVAMTQRGRLRLGHRQGWQGAVMARRDLPKSI
ncbi:hypothetical protein [Desulfosporosinus fructosivorans]